jgi:2-keto-3-deoxy-6-phosphogluconate aldolase
MFPKIELHVHLEGTVRAGTRLVVSPGSTEPTAMRAELSSFARRLGLG